MGPRFLRALAYGTASVWGFHGLFSKLLQGIPRHRLIVERVLGSSWAPQATVAIGVGELLMAGWILSGRFPRSCAAAQTVALGAMNLLELRYARDLLLAPWPMVAANLIFLGLAWVLALGRASTSSPVPA